MQHFIVFIHDFMSLEALFSVSTVNAFTSIIITTNV